MADLIPSRLTAGDSWSWDMPEAWAAYPPPDFALRVVLTPEAGGTPFAMGAAVDTGVTFRLKATPAQTAALVAGRYAWASIAEDDATGERFTIARGLVEILADPATATGDTRTPAARILVAIDATLEGRATKDAESYSIEGRSLSRTPVADLLRLKAHYAQIVAAERGHAAPFRVRRVSH